MPWEDIFNLCCWNWTLWVVQFEVKPRSTPWFSAVWATAIAYRNHFFCLHQHNISPTSKLKFRQASNHCERVLEADKLVYVNETKAIIFHKLGSGDFWQMANSVLNKGTFAIPPLFYRPKVFSSDKAKLFEKKLFQNSNFDDSGISLPTFPSKTNLKLHGIHVTFRLVKVITNLDLSNSLVLIVSAVVLKMFETKLPYTQAGLFNMFLKDISISFFSDC